MGYSSLCESGRSYILHTEILHLPTLEALGYLQVPHVPQLILSAPFVNAPVLPLA